ncbi:MAG: DNA-binding protein [Candidatus Aenigmarchaeota archaeon]|nr:DNA-binding protein [Candidatus Aenigmarchaeota archaeon]
MSGIDDFNSQRTNELQEEQNRMLEQILRKVLVPEAIQRFNNVKVVKPEIAAQLEMYLVKLYQSGQLKQPLSEEQLIQILDKVTPKTTFNIRRR